LMMSAMTGRTQNHRAIQYIRIPTGSAVRDDISASLLPTI
jgi:hypothetical protein